MKKRKRRKYNGSVDVFITGTTYFIPLYSDTEFTDIPYLFIR